MILECPDNESGHGRQRAGRGTWIHDLGVLRRGRRRRRSRGGFSRRALFGERAKWLPPYRLVPSFASADGQTAVYRRRSQIVLTDDSDNTHVAHDATVKLGGNEYKVRIDQYGYARLVRPTRSQQHVDPLSNTVDGAADMERDAALAVCKHLNEHVDGIALAHRWTPSPAARWCRPPCGRFPRRSPCRRAMSRRPPARAGPRSDAARWTTSSTRARPGSRARFAWESGQRALQERGARAAQGDAEAMHEHLLTCLHDVLWPVPIPASYESQRHGRSAHRRADARLRRAAGSRGGHRLWQPCVRAAHDRGEQGQAPRPPRARPDAAPARRRVFAALPTVQRATVTALQQPDHRAPRYIVSAQVDRKPWSQLYSSGGVIADSPEPALAALKARYNLTGLGAFMAIGTSVENRGQTPIFGRPRQLSPRNRGLTPIFSPAPANRGWGSKLRDGFP